MKRYLLACLILLVSLAAGCGEEKAAEPVTLQAKNGSYESTLQISPAVVGPNTFTATIVDQNKTVQAGGKAVLHFAMAGMEHGKSELELKADSNGKWTGEGPHLMMEGKWQLQLVWTDQAGKTNTFDYTLDLAN